MKQVCIDFGWLKYIRVGKLSVLRVGKFHRLRVGHSIIWVRKPGEAAAA